MKIYIDFEFLTSEIKKRGDLMSENLEKTRTKEMTQERCIEIYDLLDKYNEEQLRSAVEIAKELRDSGKMSLDSFIYVISAYIEDCIDAHK